MVSPATVGAIEGGMSYERYSARLIKEWRVWEPTVDEMGRGRSGTPGASLQGFSQINRLSEMERGRIYMTILILKETSKEAI